MESVICEQQKMQQQLLLGDWVVRLEANLVPMQRFGRQEGTSKSPERKKILAERMRAYRTKHPERHKAALKKYYRAHKEDFVAYRKANAARRRELYRLRREEIVARKCELLKTPKYRARANAYLRRRRREHVQFALADRMRATINRAFRRNWIEKPRRTEAFIGCTITELKAHIENQFVNGMCWENRTSFVIDHIIPVAAFDLRDTEESQCAFNWKNLRPITHHENAVKSDTLPDPIPGWLPAHIEERIRTRRPARQIGVSSSGV